MSIGHTVHYITVYLSYGGVGVAMQRRYAAPRRTGTKALGQIQHGVSLLLGHANGTVFQADRLHLFFESGSFHYICAAGEGCPQ